MRLFPVIDPMEWVVRQYVDFRDNYCGEPPKTFNVTVQQLHLLRLRLALIPSAVLIPNFDGGPEKLLGMEIQVVEPIPAW